MKWSRFRIRFGFEWYIKASDSHSDFVVYGERGLFAFEIKRSRSISRYDLKGLKAFLNDYDIAKCYLFYGGDHEEYHDTIHVMPTTQALLQLREIFGIA